MVDAITPKGTPGVPPTPAAKPAPLGKAPAAPTQPIAPDAMSVSDDLPAFLTARMPHRRLEPWSGEEDAPAPSGAAGDRGAATETARALGAEAAFGRVAAAVAGHPRVEAALADFTRNEAHSPSQRKRALEALASMSGMAVASGLDRDRLVREVVSEIADPGTINQRANDTCAPTTVQIIAASTRPAFYVDTIAGLAAASEPAETPLLGPGKLVREPGSEMASVFETTGDHRTQSARLFQCAAMELANGAAEFDAVTGRSTDPASGTTTSGLIGSQHAFLQSQVLGSPMR